MQENNDTEILIKHLEELRKKAVKEQPTSNFNKYWAYYSGDPEEGKEQTESAPRNKYNIIKGITDTKATLILDNEIVSAIMPRLKTFVDEKGLELQNDIGDILQDINEFVLDNNTWEKIKSEVVLNKLVYGVGYTETVWQQDNGEELGDVKINSLNPTNCFPDASAKEIKDCNFFFVKESFSPITLKKKYPKYAEKVKSSTTQENENKDNKNPTGIFTTSNEGTTTQSYSYGSGDSISVEKQKNVTVWKCYLKDDSTFLATETEDNADTGEAELRFLYPNGRLILYVDGATDYVLEDKPIDYPFGFPIDIFSSNTGSIWGQGEVSYLLEIQDRINRAWDKVQYTVASYHPFTLVDGRLGIDPKDILNDSILLCDNISEGGIQDFANDTISNVLNEFLAYIDKLKQTAYEIARINPMMISGERPSGVTSGEQIVQLNQSPMLAIKEEQRHFKYFICEQCQKNIVLIQLFYNTPRMIRLTNSKQVAELPAQIDQQNPETQGLMQQPIRILEQKENENGIYYEAIREIQSDLSIGEYDVTVIAGTEMPHSRTERAQITMQLANMGMLGSNKIDIAEIILTALDYPLRHTIIDKMREEEAEMSKMPPLEPPTKDIQVNFKDMPSFMQGEWCQQHGFPQSSQMLLSQEVQNINHLKQVKELVKE